MTTKEKYQKIMEVMSDKTLSKGVLIKEKEMQRVFEVVGFGEPKMNGTPIYVLDGINYIIPKGPYFWDYEIIGHPLHIGDILDWYENRGIICNKCTTKTSQRLRWDNEDGVYRCMVHSPSNPIYDNTQNIIDAWGDKRLPLSPTDIELVDYIYNLLP